MEAPSLGGYSSCRGSHPCGSPRTHQVRLQTYPGEDTGRGSLTPSSIGWGTAPDGAWPMPYYLSTFSRQGNPSPGDTESPSGLRGTQCPGGAAPLAGDQCPEGTAPSPPQGSPVRDQQPTVDLPFQWRRQTHPPLSHSGRLLISLDSRLEESPHHLQG